MEQNGENKIKNKRISISLLQLVIIIGCIVIFYIIMTPKDRVKDTTYSYSKLEEVKEYRIEGEYITRVRPLTKYETFKETAEYTLNNNQEGKTYTVKVYSDSNKTQEVEEGYIRTGMVLEGISNGNSTANETVSYTIGVIGDFTKDGDITIAELTKIIKGVVGLNDWRFTEEEKLIADFNGDKEINVVDIEECINYIVYGRLTLENGTKLKATDEYGITWNYTYQNGEATDVYYESGELTETVNIPASLDGYPVVGLRREHSGDIFKSKELATIKNVNIPSTVKIIGEDAFANCFNLANINIPNSVITIGNAAFYGCSNLTEIRMPNSVMDIGEYAFTRCTGLTKIVISDNIREIKGFTFLECIRLEEITIPNSVTSIGDAAFSGCTNLISIKIPDSVTRMGNAAIGGTAWYNNQEDGVIYAGKVAYAYKGTMPSDTTIEIKEGTKTINHSAFTRCAGLISIKIPHSVTSIGNRTFYECTGLTSIEIPNGVTSIGEGAFLGCTDLKNIKIPDSVMSIRMNAFVDTAWIDEQPDGVVYVGKVAYTYKGTMPTTTIEIKEGTKVIAERAFFDRNLTDVIIPDSVIRIEQDAFLWCRNLATVTMPKNIQYIGQGAFAGCTSLENIVIWKNVDEIGNRTFGDWREEQTINIEANEIPEGWDKEWNKECNAKIVYGYTGD